MFKYMKKPENLQTKDWFEASQSACGKLGPLMTTPHDPAPISNLVLESFQSKGFPMKPDMFATGDTVQGCGHVARTIHKGIRTTSFDYIDSNKSLTNLHIVTGQYVDSVVLEERGRELTAVAVQVQTAIGVKIRFKTSKEIILASGAYGSPAVLLRSGMGPRGELENLGIPVKMDLQGVGKNLMDHMVSLPDYLTTAIPLLTVI